jgi:DNA-binding beta-propeller fold protein YncE
MLIGGALGFDDGPLGVAQFDQPMYVACDTAGNIYVANNGNDRIRKITLADSQCAITTLVGDNTKGD